MLKQRAQTIKPKLEKPQRAPPAHMQASPEPMQLPLDECMQTTLQNREAASALLWPVDRSTSPVRPVDKIAQHLGTTLVRPMEDTG
jgi:hypothetical protein